MIHIIVIGLAFITALIGVVYYKKLTTPFRLLTWYFCYHVLNDIVNRVVIAIYKNNLIIVHCEIFVNLVFFSLIYYYLFKNKYLKLSVLILLFLGTVLFFVNFFFLQPYNKVFPSNLMLYEDILFVICSLALFKQMLQYPLQINISRQGIFWYNTAILFFYSMMFLNYALVNYYYIHNTRSSIQEFSWYFTEIGFNLLLGIAVWMNKKNADDNQIAETRRAL